MFMNTKDGVGHEVKRHNISKPGEGRREVTERTLELKGSSEYKDRNE